MFGLNVTQWAMLGGTFAIWLVLRMFGGKIWSAVTSVRIPTSESTVTLDNNADLAAFERLRVRLKNCKEAQAGLDAVWQHFWHTSEGE